MGIVRETVTVQPLPENEPATSPGPPRWTWIFPGVLIVLGVYDLAVLNAGDEGWERWFSGPLVAGVLTALVLLRVRQLARRPSKGNFER
ncbi:hypothetical protein GCM10025875_07160 [Litorihabitans aurantiacus]|uniref:Uncharacterized protein n=1 Tax=Litorihabitans aurantiacus TaxID=1930061 RepID=A0AA37UMK6_9MICO|nr:hypothetical protein GCM10025875_07160 [Litorihabitans aurantiacus]